MVLGICPTVDFAFKKTFGDQANSVALISLLNAILELAQPITSVVIENPFNYQDFDNDKLSILDVKATDTQGTIFHIEMQVSATPAMAQRLAFYACELYAGQLSDGKPYTRLCPVYSICLLNDTLWRTDPTSHHRFRLADTQTGRILEPSLEIHLLELPKYTVQESDLGEATQVARWVYWLYHAQAPGRFLRREFRQLLTELQRIGLAHRLHRQARPPESTGVLACHPFILRLGHHKHTQLKARFGFRFNSKVCPPPYRGIPAKRLFNWVAVDIKIKKSMPATTRKSSHAPTVPGQQADSVPVGA